MCQLETTITNSSTSPSLFLDKNQSYICHGSYRNMTPGIGGHPLSLSECVNTFCVILTVIVLSVPIEVTRKMLVLLILKEKRLYKYSVYPSGLLWILASNKHSGISEWWAFFVRYSEVVFHSMFDEWWKVKQEAERYVQRESMCLFINQSGSGGSTGWG